ncbi:MAG: response regulator [Bacteroidota bacterium]
MSRMKVLIVDDSTYIRKTIRTTLEDSGCEVIGEASDGETAIDLTHEHLPELITLDNILPDMNGMDVLKALRKSNIDAKVIMISAIGQESSRREADELGVSEYLIKPIDHNNLKEIISKIK